MICRVKVEIAVQVFRKYKAYWIGYLKNDKVVMLTIRKKQKKQNIVFNSTCETIEDVKRVLQAITTVMTQKLEKQDGTYVNKHNLKNSLVLFNWNKDFTGLIQDIERTLRKVAETTNNFLSHYKSSGFSRNIYYLLERLVQIIYTYEDYIKNVCEVINLVKIDLNNLEIEDIAEEVILHEKQEWQPKMIL